MSRFIKFIPSEKSEWLAINRPIAFILLYIVATRARRTPNSPDGLEIGECHLGDWASYGMTERQYRTAKSILCKLNILRIIETNRNRKNATTGSTTRGTKVKLLDSSIWDLNLESIDDRKDDRATTDRRLTDDEQECKNDKNEKKKEKIKKEKISEIPKISFRENVTLTQIEYDKLLALHGDVLLSSMLDILDAYKGSNNKQYSSDYSTMKPGGWVTLRAIKERDTPQKSKALDRSTKDKNGNVILSYAEERNLF